MKHVRFVLLFITFVLPGSTLAAVPKPIGWIENVALEKMAIEFEAKIDTGADMTSVNARVLEITNRDGAAWVRFVIQNKDEDELVLEKPIVRYVSIKRKRAEPLERPVVMMDVCIGDVQREVEVNLSQRENFSYKLLIGRNFLHSYFMVDSAAQYTSRPACKR